MQMRVQHLWRLATPLLVASLSAFAQQALDQQPESVPATAKPRPRIGLVLEGGGALGLAHIGVLQWFEQHHIPVDAVAGTSMGGLIGGFYASGMSAQEIDSYIRTINWNKTFRNQTPYRDRSFRRKEDKREYPADLEFGLKDGVSLPSGFNSGQEVGLILDRVGAPYFALKTFDDLPTPFRCVATDLVSETPRVFDHGSLADALRGTMSLPGVFSPVRENGGIFVDGGVLDNLPVDVARAMGADIVIAVHLQVKPLTPDEKLSAFGVLQESVSVVISANELESMEKADVLISVHTQAYSTLDYEDADKLVQLGVEAAQEKANLLGRFALDEAEWKAFVEARESRRRSTPAPEFVKVVGPGPEVARGLEKGLKRDVGGPLNYDRLNQDLEAITGLGRFSRAGFQIVQREGQPGLLVRAEEKDYGPPLVNPLIFVDGSDYQNVRFSLGARITLLDLGGFGSEWRNDIIAGSDYSVMSEYYHPFTWSSPFFVAPRMFASTAPFDLYDNDERVASYRDKTAGGGLDFGIAFNRYSQLRVGYQIEHLSFSKQIGSAYLRSLSGRQGFSRVLYKFDDTDDPTLPRQGITAQTRLEFYDGDPGATRHFPLFETQTGFFQRISKPSSIFLLASGGTTFGRDDTGLPQFSLGSPLRLGAYGTNELLTDQYFLVQPGYIRRLTQLSPLLGNNVYAIAAYEIGKTYGNIFRESNLPNDVNVGILVQTFFGPVVFGGSVGDAGHRKFYFQVGRYF